MPGTSILGRMPVADMKVELDCSGRCSITATGTGSCFGFDIDCCLG